MRKLYPAIRELLVDRGWKIDMTALESKDGELREFIHPETGRRMAWFEAVLAQQAREPN